VSHESLLRAIAVVAAVALVVAPYWRDVVGVVTKAVEATVGYRQLAGRVLAAVLLIAAAWQQLPIWWPETATPTINVETPTAEMQQLVAPVATALKKLPAGSRMIWAQTWTKAAVVVSGDAVTTEVVFTDTRSLRLFVAIAMDIAWRRIGGNIPGQHEDLRVATEAAYATVLGKDVVPVTVDVRSRFAELAKALAWAGVNKG
jgi:hypothetical protein